MALVFISADSGEGYITVEGNAGDRNDLNAWHSGNAVRRAFFLLVAFSKLIVREQLVAAVAAVNPNTIVVIHSVGVRRAAINVLVSEAEQNIGDYCGALDQQP